MGTIAATPVPNLAKITVSVTMASTVTKVQIFRQDPEGAMQLLRYGDQVSSPGGKVTIEDYECPLDTYVYYYAKQAVPTGSETAQSVIVQLASNNKSWLKDPGSPTYNVMIPVVTAIPTLTRASRMGVFPILDRVNPIIVTAKRSGAVGTLTCHTLTDQERISLTDLLARGTTLLLQTPAAYGFGSKYVVMGDADEARVGLAMEQSRQWTLPFTVVDRPEGLGSQPTVSRTWQDVKNVYPTWNDLTNSGKTWDRLVQEGP